MNTIFTFAELVSFAVSGVSADKLSTYFSEAKCIHKLADHVDGLFVRVEVADSPYVVLMLPSWSRVVSKVTGCPDADYMSMICSFAVPVSFRIFCLVLSDPVPTKIHFPDLKRPAESLMIAAFLGSSLC